MKSSSATRLAPRLLTLAEWADMDEEEPGELVDGALEEEEVPTVLHDLVVTWILACLFGWARTRRGIVLPSETKLAVAPKRGRKPDVSVYLPPALPAPGDALVSVAPHIVVEVLSPRPRDARRDRVDKLGDYAGARAKYYWIVNPKVRTLEIFALSPRGRRYTHALAATRGLLLDVPGCPGMELDLDGMWAQVDALEASTKARPRRRPTKSRK